MKYPSLILLLLCLTSISTIRAATFNVEGSALQVNLVSANETVAITTGASNYTMVLTGGTWSGTNSAPATGNGTTTLSAVKASIATVTVDDNGTGNAVTFNNSGSNTYSANFTITLDSTTAGTISFNGTSAFAGSASLSASTSRNIAVNSAAIVSTQDGSLTLMGNMQTPTRTGSFDGVTVTSAQVKSTGVGNLTLRGTGTYNQSGVRLAGGSLVSGGITGTSTVIEGFGGGNGSTSSVGVLLQGTGTIVTTRGGNVMVSGKGGANTNDDGRGIAVAGWGAAIQSTGSGSITLNGTGGGGSWRKYGIELGHTSEITSIDGDITVSGTGGGENSIYAHSNCGLVIRGSIHSSGVGKINVSGIGGLGPVGSNDGVRLQKDQGSTIQQIKSASGNVTVNGTGGSGPNSFGINMDSSPSAPARITAGVPGLITLMADSMNFTESALIHGSLVTIMPMSAGRIIDLGSTSEIMPGTLSLSQSELATITATTLLIGGGNTSLVNLSSNISLPQIGALNLSGAAIKTNSYNVSPSTTTTQLFTGQPLIVVQQPANSVIEDGGKANFGKKIFGSTTDLEFNVSNVGSGNLTGMTISGVSGTDFSIISNPTTPLPPSNSTSFTIRFTPTSLGVKTATLRLASNALGHPNFEINLEGKGASAELTGTKTVGPTGDFATLTSAINSIQTNLAVTGHVILELLPTYTSGTETFPITFSNLDTTTTNRLTIRPQLGATALSISSADALATIDLNGAQFVTFDGRPGGLGSHPNSGGGAVSQLTIANTNVAGVALRLINKSSYNNIHYTILRSVNTSSTKGTVLFSITNGADGNDSNTIDHCDIRDGATTPVIAIYSANSTKNKALFNSANTVSNCNVFNFYSTSVVSGVYLAAGNTDWIISGNSFYQTSVRPLSSSLVSPIYISETLGSNFTVTGNFIGGSAPLATGSPWEIQGSISFLGIGLYVGTTSPSNVQGNTIGNLTCTTNLYAVDEPGVWSGIHVGAGNVNVGTLAGNTIGGNNATKSVTITTAAPGGTGYGISSTSSGAVNISNNLIGSIHILRTNTSTPVSSAASFIGISVSSGENTINNNIVGNLVTPDSIIATNPSSISFSNLQVTGILSRSAPNATVGTITSVTGNTVANLKNDNASTYGGQIRGIVVSLGINTILGNTVRNLTTQSQNSNDGTDQSVIGISIASSLPKQMVSQNVVHSLANTAPSQAVKVTGILFSAAGGSYTVARNFVHSLSISSSNIYSEFYGIQIDNHVFVDGFMVQNNIVRIGLNAGGSNTAAASALYGIFDGSDIEGLNIFHNSIYIGGTQTTGASPTYAFRSVGLNNGRAFQNNIFVNARSNSGATSKHYAVAYGAYGGQDPLVLNSGGNLFYVSGNGGKLGYFDGADRNTLAAWRSATGQDSTSAFANPNFVNPYGNANNVDLHLIPSNPAEGGGIALTDAISGLPLVATDDFDGSSRASLTPVDIGADAGNFNLTPGDIFAPSIRYMPLTDGSTNNRVLGQWAAITDNTGLVSSGAKMPRLYFKKSTDADSFVENTSGANGWKYVTATGTGNTTYSFTIDYSLINGGGVIVGDTIEYFVVAQDDANNLSSSPSGAGFSSIPPILNLNSNQVLGFSFAIRNALSGAKTVGSGGDYPSLGGSNGLFTAINNSVITGNVTIQIISDLTETATAGLNQWLELGTGGYTLTIQPSAATMRTITGFDGLSNGLLEFNGADRVIIDGRFDGAGRFLTIRDSATGGFGSTILFQNDASDNIVRNCVVEGSNASAFEGVITFGKGSVTGNDNNIISECQIRNVRDSDGAPNVLISSSGSGSLLSNSNNKISKNILFNFNEVGIRIGPISQVGESSWSISENEIYQSSPGGSGGGGIYIGSNGVNLITGNYIHDLTATGTNVSGISCSVFGTNLITRNRITALGSNVASTTISGIAISSFGISNTTSQLPSATIANNFITLSPSVPVSISIYGIYDVGLSGIVANVFHNTIVIGGMESGANNSWASFKKDGSTHNSRNNIFLNRRTGGTGTHFAAGLQSNTGSYKASNNLYAGYGASAANFMDFSSTTTASPISYSTWTNWVGDSSSKAGVAGTGQFTSAMFVNAAVGDLHLIPGGNPLVNGNGIPIPEITTDYDGTNRSLTAPYLGADEPPLPNQAPTFAGYGFSVEKSTPASLSLATILARAADSDGGTLAVTTVSATSSQGGTVSLGSANVTYSPPANFVGLDIFTLTIADGQGGSVIGTITASVETGDAPNSTQVSQISRQPGGQISVLLFGAPNQVYLIQRSPDLQMWSVIQTLQANSNGSLPFTDPAPLPGSGFYRRVLP